MSNEIKVGDWTVTDEAIKRLRWIFDNCEIHRRLIAAYGAECCDLFGIDATTDSVARDICEEIVLHGTPVEEVVAKLQRHLASPHSGDFS